MRSSGIANKISFTLAFKLTDPSSDSVGTGLILRLEDKGVASELPRSFRDRKRFVTMLSRAFRRFFRTSNRHAFNDSVDWIFSTNEASTRAFVSGSLASTIESQPNCGKYRTKRKLRRLRHLRSAGNCTRCRALSFEFKSLFLSLSTTSL